jgi:hypothetical protein
VLIVLMNSIEFLTWCGEPAMCAPSRPARCWAKRWCSRWAAEGPFLSMWIFGSPYSLGGLEPYDRSCCTTSSGSDDFLRRKVVFRSTASVGSLCNLR